METSIETVSHELWKRCRVSILGYRGVAVVWSFGVINQLRCVYVLVFWIVVFFQREECDHTEDGEGVCLMEERLER